MTNEGIPQIAYSSLVPLSSWRAAENHDSAKTDAMRAGGERVDSPLGAMADKYGVSEAQVLLRWAAQRGYPVLPKSMDPARHHANINLFSFTITEDDMRHIATPDRGDGVAWSVGDATRSA